MKFTKKIVAVVVFNALMSQLFVASLTQLKMRAQILTVVNLVFMILSYNLSEHLSEHRI